MVTSPTDPEPSTTRPAGLDTTYASAESSESAGDAEIPALGIDRLALHRQQQQLLARMFGVEVEPQQLGHYELLDELGRGGMGVVYAAHDRSLDRKVAIKLMTNLRGSELRRRFEREAKAMAKLAHPNVVQVYEIGEAEGSTFIAMEYVEGVTLRAWLADPRSRDEILDAFVAAGRGLAAARTHDNRGCAIAAVVEGRGRVNLEASDIHWDLKQGPIEDRIDACNRYRPWDPNQPHFYDVALEIADGW